MLEKYPKGAEAPRVFLKAYRHDATEYKESFLRAEKPWEEPKVAGRPLPHTDWRCEL